MAIEHEIKARITDEEYVKIKEKLMFLNARYETTILSRDTYYSTGKDDDLLRVRVHSYDDGEYSSFITYKGAKMNELTKTRPEEESRVADGVALANILSALGNEKIATFGKKREVYRFGNLYVCKDDVEKLGSFIEIEVVIKDRDYMIPGSKPNFDVDEFILNFAKLLGLNDIVNKSYLELYQELGEVTDETL